VFRDAAVGRDIGACVNPEIAPPHDQRGIVTQGSGGATSPPPLIVGGMATRVDAIGWRRPPAI
jgi:hypothetical protein